MSGDVETPTLRLRTIEGHIRTGKVLLIIDIQHGGDRKRRLAVLRLVQQALERLLDLAGCLTALLPGRQPLPDEDLAAEMYEMMLDKTAEKGYEQYEISNFCRYGQSGAEPEKRHFSTAAAICQSLGFYRRPR